MSSKGFASRAQSAGDRNAATNNNTNIESKSNNTGRDFQALNHVGGKQGGAGADLGKTSGDASRK
jgi:hypothetical protein